MLLGYVYTEIVSMLYGEHLIAITKKDSGVRPIAVHALRIFLHNISGEKML